MIQVSWTPGNGATPGGPGIEYRLVPGQDTTPPLNFNYLVLGGWGGGASDYTGPGTISIPAGVNEGCSLVDDFGTLVQSMQVNVAHGSGASRTRVKVTAPSMPGGLFKDIGLVLNLPDGQGGGQSNNLRVYFAAPPPTQKVTWEVKVNGQSMGYTLQTNQSDNVTFHRNGAMVWPNYIPGA